MVSKFVTPANLTLAARRVTFNSKALILFTFVRNVTRWRRDCFVGALAVWHQLLGRQMKILGSWRRAVVVGSFVGFAVSGAHAVVVNSIDPTFMAAGQWYVNSQADGGSASIGPSPAGGPLPSDALKLTTKNTDASKIEVSVSDSFGTAGNLAGGVNLSYSYFKDSVGGNAAAAPSIKLTFLNATYSSIPGNDGFITLVYEPYWNLGANPSVGDWNTVNIDYNNGLFWVTGGFGVPNTAGGPPLKTLGDWVTVLNAGSGNAFSNASITQLTLGLGTYNQGQVGYVDDVEFAVARSQYSGAFNFQAAATAVPEPGSLALLGLGLAGLAAIRKRKQA